MLEIILLDKPKRKGTPKNSNNIKIENSNMNVPEEYANDPELYFAI
jgi:hypothetical protein